MRGAGDCAFRSIWKAFFGLPHSIIVRFLVFDAFLAPCRFQQSDDREREKEIRSRNIVIIIIIITITIAEIMAQRDASAASSRPEIYKEDGFG